jgi:hypothetical protein
MRRLLVLLATLTAGVLFALPAVPGLAGTGGHAAITISSNADFATCGCVTSGNGTAASPYVIGPWTINAPSAGGWSVKVANTTKYFNVVGISSTYNDTTTTHPTIWLDNVNTPPATATATISGASGNGLSVGIELDNSFNVSIENVSYNKDNGTGVLINNSSNVSINNSKFKSTCNICQEHTGDAIYAVGSSDLWIGTGADCPNSAPCNDFTYDDGFGVYLQDTHDVTINQAVADANDTGGYVLDGHDTYNVKLENSGSQGGGSICHTYLGSKMPTGYTTDLQGGLHLINGTHDNTFTNDTFSNNTTMDIASGGNGFFYNPCAGGDQPWPTSAIEGAAGLNNNFTNICYHNTSGSLPHLPPSTCKS